MCECETAGALTGRPRVTVAAVVEREGRFLLVRERSPAGDLVINQPAGHLEVGETLIDAVIRETREETGWRFIPQAFVGVYQWRNAAERKSFVRFAFCGSVTHRDAGAILDEGVEEVVWLTLDDVSAQSAALRSPLVERGIRDYLGGQRFPLTLLTSLV